MQPTQAKRPRPVVLCVLDGWGYREECDENAICQAEYAGRNPAALATLVNEYKVQLKQFPRPVIAALGTAAGETMQELYDTGDDTTRKIASSYFKFRKQAMAWTRVSYAAFADARDAKFDYPAG